MSASPPLAKIDSAQKQLAAKTARFANYVAAILFALDPSPPHAAQSLMLNKDYHPPSNPEECPQLRTVRPKTDERGNNLELPRTHILQEKFMPAITAKD